MTVIPLYDIKKMISFTSNFCIDAPATPPVSPSMAAA